MLAQSWRLLHFAKTNGREIVACDWYRDVRGGRLMGLRVSYPPPLPLPKFPVPDVPS